MSRTSFRHHGIALLTFAFAMSLLLVSRSGPSAQDQPAGNKPVPMPPNLTGVLISLGLKDQQAVTWEGEVSISEGKILSLDIVQGNVGAAKKAKAKAKAKKTGKVEGTRFNVATVVGKKKEGIVRPILRATLDAPATARLTVQTNQGKLDAVLDELSAATPKVFLDGQASLRREDGALRLTEPATEDDYPALARAPDGKIWLAYNEYTKGKPYVTERVLAGNFDELIPKGHGDQVKLKYFDGNIWSSALDVTGTGLNVWRPAVAVNGKGIVHIAWAQQEGDNWEIFHRTHDPAGKSSPIRRVTNSPGADLHVVATTAPDGKVWIAWQGWRDGSFQIFAMPLGGEARQLTQARANHWCPTIAADSRGNVYVAYDTYEKENYDIRVCILGNGPPKTIDIASSARFEARPNIVCDAKDRVWIAYEEGDEQWGKDYSTNMFRKIGFDENPGYALYINRTVRVKCLVDGKLMQPAGDLTKAWEEALPNNKSVPRLAVDAGGGLWLSVRHHPRPLGAGEVWNSYALRYDGKAWSSPRRLAQSDNLLDNRPAFVAHGNGLLAVYSGDGRSRTQDRKQNDLYAALFPAGPAQPAQLIPADPTPKTAMKPVHKDEIEQTARIRDYRFAHEAKKLRLIRGEFHRHTEYTAHRDQDGLLEDAWRYALDAGKLDWMGNGDHDNGIHDEYSWWQIQKITDLFQHPPYFVAVQSYERSNVFPNGHRNVIMPKRGIRPLPRGDLKSGDEKTGTPDTKILYAYLKHFGGMCSSHTSGTTMGTDWRDNDPIVEPVVEIYQGHRHNYEHFGAPRSATKDTQIGGYEPSGFVWNAFAKGYKMGFQASSDHVSTHMSYGVVLTDDVSRQGIIDAFKRRHSYAATDNIILEFRSGKHIMGDIFETDQKPTFEVIVKGTSPVSKLSIVRSAKYIHVEEPKKSDVKVTFTDDEAPAGKTSYYYVRIEQTDGNLAWASPMWITYRGK